MVYPDNGILFSHKKKRSSDAYYNPDEPGKHHAKYKKPDTKGYVLYDSLYMKCPQQANPQRQKLGKGLGRGLQNGWTVSCPDANVGVAQRRRWA